MKTEILVRCYTPELVPLQKRIVNLINMLTELVAVEVDHTNLTLKDFNYVGGVPVSIDKHLAEKFNIPYMQVSRVFNTRGDVVSRRINISPDVPLLAPNVVVLDTDIVEGHAVAIAQRILQTDRHSVPLRIKAHQDLVDVEDLVYRNSHLEDGTMCSYLKNIDFFVKRTSLPEDMMLPIFKEVLAR